MQYTKVCPPVKLKTKEVYWYHNDYLGTTKAMSDITGTIVWNMSQSPFGIVSVNNDVDNNGNIVINNFRFKGQYFDKETGLNYNYFRSYDPLKGRYTQPDPIGLIGGMNRFGYVEGNPLTYSDPLGLFWFRQDWQPDGVVGRRGSIVESREVISQFIENFIPAGYTFGQLHDAFVERQTSLGMKDIYINIPSMLPLYQISQYIEILRSLGMINKTSNGECKP